MSDGLNLFKLRATIGLDTSEYEQKIKDTIEDAQESGEKISDALNGGGSGSSGTSVTVDNATKSVSTFGTTVKSVLAADYVQKGISIITSTGREAVNAASDLVEVQNVIDQTFGSSADQINRWAEAQAGAYGLSQLQAKQFAGYYGSMLQTAGIDKAASAEMSMNLAELAGDIASFHNVGIEEAYQKILSGLAGEREPLLRYGLDLGAEAIGEYAGIKMEDLTNAERFQARYDYLMANTGTIQGNYMQTANELANGQRTLVNNLNRLSASFGEKLLPIMKAGTNAANDFFAALYSESAEETLANIEATAKSTSDSIEGTATNARAMVGVLEDYGDKSALTAEQQAQWSTVASELVRMIPQLSGMIDMQTGKIDGGTQALYQSIGAWEAESKAAADTSAMEEKRGMLADLSAEIANEQGMLAIAEKQLEQNQSEVIALGAKVAETLGKEFDGTVESTRKLLDSNAGWYAALKTGLSETDIYDMLSPVNEAETAIAEHKENIAALQTEYSTVEQSVERDSAALSETVGDMQTSVTGSFEDIESATDSLVSNFDQSGTAYSNAYNTGIAAANGLSAAYPSYREAASQYTFDSPAVVETDTENIDSLPRHAGGLYYARNDYVARLDEGEAVLTQREATDWRAGRSSGNADLLAEIRALRQDLMTRRPVMTPDGRVIGEISYETVSQKIAQDARGRRYVYG